MTETTLTVIRAVRDVQRMPDGEPIPHGLKHALIVLASYYPHIWPGQHQLAVDMGITRRNVNKRLRLLEDAGLIVRTRRGPRSTLYRLDMKLVKVCRQRPVGSVASDLEDASEATQEYQYKSNEEQGSAHDVGPFEHFGF